MNELMVGGGIYWETDKVTAKEAYEEFRKAAEKIGMNIDNMGFDIVLRNSNYEDIDTWEVGDD